jgi:redox-sensing transcriptional repressor
MMVIRKNINRLLRYRSLLVKMQDLGFETVYSYNLGKEAGVSPEQVRKDFSQFGLKGKKKGGYNVIELLFTINNIFRKDELQNVILVGMGNIGHSLLKYRGFKDRMIQIVATFDIDPSKYRKNCNIPCYPMEELGEMVAELGVKTAIVAVPERAVKEVCDQLVNAGILGILSFAPNIIKVPPHVTINNISISHELESLIYQTLHVKRD